MPPRKRAAAKVDLEPLRKALEVDLARLNLSDRHALVELARKLADELDREPAACFECGGHAGPNPATILRYADVLEALGIGSRPAEPPKDTFTRMLEDFNGLRRP